MPRVAADQRTARAAASVAVTSTARSLTRTAARRQVVPPRAHVLRYCRLKSGGK